MESSPEDLTLSAAAMALFRRAMKIDLDAATNRYSRDFGLPQVEAERRMTELRRFLVLSALSPGNAYGMRGPIDDAWHTLILFTRDYAGFCQMIAGRFIHHQPDAMPSDREKSGNAYSLFLREYERAFGEAAPADLWPRL